MIPIIIPTVGRPRLITMEFLTPSAQKHVTLVTNKATQSTLSKAYPKAVVMACPHQPEPGKKVDLSYQGISHVRQWILKQFKTGHAIMSDDDLPFYVRKNPKKWSDWHARRATPDEVTVAFEKMADLTKKYPMVGMSSKQGNNRHATPILYCTRMHNIWTIDIGLANQHKLSFTNTPTMQDFWMQLSFLTMGYQTAMIADYMHCQYNSNQEGGCSLFRSPETQRISSQALAKRWPSFVKVVKKETKGKTRWFPGQPRYDVQIAWKKAYEFGTTTKSLL